jgi:seryl-tRNA synthetase
MIDIERVRRNPEKYRETINAKRIPLDLDRLLNLDAQCRELTGRTNQLREKRNKLSEQVAQEPQNKQQLIEESRQNGEQLTTLQTELTVLAKELDELLGLVPGIPVEGVPVGETDKDNVEIRRWGEVKKRTFVEKDHMQLAAQHKLVDLDGARQVAGSRAYALLGDGALLELAILRFALDRVVNKGFIPVLPPLMVNRAAMFGTGYFPLGEDNAYELEEHKMFLTGTSEVGIVAMQMNRLFNQDELPARFVGISTCFRKEAGSAGRDVRGLYRVHQFQKVEQVVFCENDPEVAAKEHVALLQNAEDILQALELPYRVVAVCTGDMGLGQVQKHDLETWMPSRQAYCETHSCSTFDDFQARRLNLRYRGEDKKKKYLCTLNNTAIASPRILIPFLENHQNEDGTIYVPPALRPYLGNREQLGVSP